MKTLTVIALSSCLLLAAPSDEPTGLAGAVPSAHAATPTSEAAPEAGRRHRSVTVYGAMW
jgi:hypothetical protein